MIDLDLPESKKHYQTIQHLQLSQLHGIIRFVQDSFLVGCIFGTGQEKQKHHNAMYKVDRGGWGRQVSQP
jgi:hypothetical protein